MKALSILLVAMLGLTACKKNRNKTSNQDRFQTEEEILEDDSLGEEADEITRNAYQEEEDADDLYPRDPAPRKVPSLAWEGRRQGSGHALYLAAVSAIRAGNRSRARELYLQACQNGSVAGCHRYGYHLWDQGNVDGAVRFFVHACRRGIQKSCNNLGWIAEKAGKTGRAKDYYSIACMKKHSKACRNLRRLEVVPAH